MTPVALLSVLMLATPVEAVPYLTSLRVDREMGAARQMTLEAGQNRLLLLSESIARVAVADPAVADLKVVTPTQVLLTAKGAGNTDLTLWNTSNQPLVIALQVTRSVEALRKQLKELFPKEDKVSVAAAGELVVLSGDVSDLRVPERMAEVARLHSKQVANLIGVSGNHQVQLEVRFAEVTRTGMRDIGFNFYGRSTSGSMVGGQQGPANSLGQYANTNQQYVPGTGGDGRPPLMPVQPLAQTFSLFFGSTSPFPFSMVLSLLEQNGLAKILAEPTLVTLSGQEAKFLAGGEFPVPTTSTLGSANVQWKKFGILLNFTPTVIDAGTINLKMFTEVSDIDSSAGVTTGGFFIPGLISRQSETTVRLGDGQSFAIAGLMSDKVRTSVSKVPLLGSIPILGALFSSNQFQRQESELLVVITARLVKPVAPHEAPRLPTDYDGAAPSAFGFFLMSQEGGGPPDGEPPPPARGPSGNAGFSR